jgi:hypothetical protein
MTGRSYSYRHREELRGTKQSNPANPHGWLHPAGLRVTCATIKKSIIIAGKSANGKTGRLFYESAEAPRIDRCKEHLPEDIIFITIAAVIRVAET